MMRTAPPSLILAAVLTTLAALAAASPAHACTSFLLERGAERVFGKSYDWDNGRGLVLVNKRGLHKSALLLNPAEKPAVWTSRHASLTFNQYGRELPNGGINDAGLVVEILWLQASRYPRPDARPVVNELQWIQYQLDNHATVADVVTGARQLRVAPVHGRVHYLACDAGGDCAAFEYLDGKLEITAGKALAIKALTNDTFRRSAAWLRQHVGFGGRKALPAGTGSLSRFVRTAARVRKPHASQPLVDQAFAALQDVADPGRTQWQIVYEPAQLRVHVRTHRAAAVKTFDLGRVDRSCNTGPRMLDVDAPLEGEVTDRLVDYDESANRKLVRHSLEALGSPLRSLLVDEVASYPGTARCQLP